MNKTKKTTRVGALLGLAGTALLLAACASQPVPPIQELQAAQFAIQSAEQARAGEHAAFELGMAREKLAAAEVAVQNEDMPLATRMAEQSRAEAELAMARSQMTKALIVNQEMRDGTESLKQEMQRNTGVKP
ncbi:DUF4398 domain-containing protein [Ectopseudomonas chengduensis]